MGHGLSELQRSLLTLAGRKFDKWAGRDSLSQVLFYSEALMHCFAWTKNAGRFPRRNIGAAQYNKAMATISRSVRRLEARGLVEKHKGPYWTGFKITPEGRDVLRASETAGKGVSPRY